MSYSEKLNILGLTLNILGVIILFIWGPPQPSLEEGFGIGLEGGAPIDDQGTTVDMHDEKVRKKKKRFTCMSRVGLGLVLLGFICQLLAALK
jgi:hypothetical protein